jgi:prepilin-type N-terminal cleavage/methylation domain-containing protein
MSFFSKPNLYRTTGHKGMTLIEVMVALSIFALVVAGALSLFTSAQSTQSATQLKTNIYSIRSAVRNLYFGQGGYGTGSLNTVMVASKKVPSTWATTASGTSALINTPLNNGAVTITGVTSTFTIAIAGVPSEVCQGLISGLNDWSSIKTTSTTGGVAQPVTPDAATTSCGNSGVQTITFESN